ncbi:GNAT family N-acetyltransferase [Kitasatospora kifunensis]|uniref:RimJ/RimL family protein N-acetyltransferase n=1 Tax=Kitasatospora kifunensis TaxID=58351 RepID=A0A7W7QZ67_KITKI|nr:GNAT family N-acetyltransferase [Kitasatospora kifunensis]MBB4922518.1 RimJ/RimL family protein N-acetyltransferase [Kitasatospora kifunensis]
MTELLTPRLRLRSWRPDDLAALSELNADPEVMRYIADGSVLSPEQSAEQLARFRRLWDEQGFGLFPVERRDSGEFLGWVGLAVPAFLPEVLPAVEIGWRLKRSAWGHGYATEAARTVLALGFEELGLDRVVSICHVDNHASANVMTKLGLTLDRRTTVPSHGGAVKVLALTGEDYRSAAADRPRF